MCHLTFNVANPLRLDRLRGPAAGGAFLAKPLDHRLLRLGSIAAVVVLWVTLDFMDIGRATSSSTLSAPRQQVEPDMNWDAFRGTDANNDKRKSHQADVAADVATDKAGGLGGVGGDRSEIGKLVPSKIDGPEGLVSESGGEGKEEVVPSKAKESAVEGPSKSANSEMGASAPFDLKSYLNQWEAVDAVTWRGAPWKREVGLWLKEFGQSEEVEIEEVPRQNPMLTGNMTGATSTPPQKRPKRSNP